MKLVKGFEGFEHTGDASSMSKTQFAISKMMHVSTCQHRAEGDVYIKECKHDKCGDDLFPPNRCFILLFEMTYIFLKASKSFCPVDPDIPLEAVIS